MKTAASLFHFAVQRALDAHRPLFSAHPGERALEAAACVLALACLLSGCTQIKIAGPAPAAADAAPAIAASQVGGMATIEHGDTRIAIDNRESWRDTTDMAKSLTQTLSLLRATVATLDMRKAKHAAEAANETARITAGTEGQRIAADQAIRLQELENQAAEAALAVP